MKNIVYIFLGLIFIGFSSCYKTDNYDGPDAQIGGTIIDSYTGKPLLSSQADWAIRVWERSWTESAPINQDIPVKQDGTFNNNKMFAGTYDILPYGGPFWPITDTIKNVTLGKGKNGGQQTITVTPYLQLIDFDATLQGTELTLQVRLKAPIRAGLPNLVDVKPFLSLTDFVGESNYINIAEFNDKRIQLNQAWMDAYGDVDTSPLLTIGPLPVKSGYTYNVRVGANVNDANRKYNYSEIKQIVVP